jgi:hypothetical protein
MRRDTAAPFDRAFARLYSASAEADRVWHRLGDVWEKKSRDQRATRNPLEMVIADFLREAEEGRARAVGDRPYTREELRKLRAALIHIASELGTMSVEDVRVWDVHALIDHLREAGLPPSRLNSIIAAFRALYAYAERRRLVEKSPVPALSFLGRDHRAEARGREQRTPARTPTGAMLALGTKVVNWTERLVLLAFVLLVLALGVELGLVDSIPFP